MSPNLAQTQLGAFVFTKPNRKIPEGDRNPDELTCQQMTGNAKDPSNIWDDQQGASPSNGSVRDSIARQPANWVVVASVVGISIVWGSTFLAYKVSLVSFQPFTLAAIRFTTGGSILLLWGLIRARPRRWPTPSEWRTALLAGLVLFAIGNGAVVWSQQHLASALGGLLVSTIPVWTALFAVVFFHEHVSRTALVALAIGIFGTTFLLLGSGEMEVVGSSNVAIIVALVGAAAWAYGSLMIRGKQAKGEALVSAGMQMFCGGIMLALMAVLAGELSRVGETRITFQAALGLFYLAVPNALTFGTFVWLLRVASPVMVSSYAYISPIVAVILGWSLLDETLTGLMLGGGALILISVSALVGASGRAAKRSALPPAPVLYTIEGAIEDEAVE